MVSQTGAGSGSVTIIELFIGRSRRCRPGSRAVNPSVARTTQRARTSPPAVRTRHRTPPTPPARPALAALRPPALAALFPPALAAWLPPGATATPRPARRIDAQPRRALEDLDPSALHRRRQPPYQLRRLYPGAVRAEQRPHRPAHPHPGVGVLRPELADVVGSQAPRPVGRERRPQPVHLRRPAGHGQRATQVDVGIDALRRADPHDLSHRVDQAALQRHHPGAAPRSARQDRPIAGQQAGQPAAVAAAGAEPDVLGFNDRDAPTAGPLSLGQSPSCP